MNLQDFKMFDSSQKTVSHNIEVAVATKTLIESTSSISDFFIWCAEA